MSCPARFAFLAIVFGALALLCANTASAGATTRSAVEAAAQHHESAGAARLVASHASVSLRAGRLSGAVTTSNVGNVGAPATVATVRLSRNGRKIVVHVGRFDVPALRPHHHQRLAFSLAVPPHATAGRYRVEVCLDVLRHVKQRSRRLVCTGAGIVLLRSASTRTTTPPFDISPPSDVESLSCPSATFCVAVTGDGGAYTFGGRSWSAADHIDTALTDVSCPSASFCAAVDTSGHALTFNGKSWSVPVTIDTDGVGGSVSCPSASFCAVTDYYGHAETFNGTGWSSPTFIDGSYFLPGSDVGTNSVSCSSASSCFTIDDNNNVVSFDGRAWSVSTRLGPLHPDETGIWHVSCPSASFCAALDSAGYTLTYDGESWSPDVWLAPYQAAFTGIACSSASFCIGLDIDGLTYSYDSRYWTGPTATGLPHSAAAISCTSRSFCGSVSGDGVGTEFNGLAWVAARPIVPFPVPAQQVTKIACVPVAQPNGETICS